MTNLIDKVLPYLNRERFTDLVVNGQPLTMPTSLLDSNGRSLKSLKRPIIAKTKQQRVYGIHHMKGLI